jgi:hypothetical protein
MSWPFCDWIKSIASVSGGEDQPRDIAISEPKGLANKHRLDLNEHIIVSCRIT